MKETSTVDLSRAVGEVSCRWVGRGGEIVLPTFRNMMSYSAAGAVAAAYGGDTSLVPKYIGFMYGPAGSTPWEYGRDMTWGRLRAEVEETGCNVMVSSFSHPPTVLFSGVYGGSVYPGGEDGPADSNDGGNARPSGSVTFHAYTRSGDESSRAFAHTPPLGDGDLMLHVLLLGKSPAEEYSVLARASLKHGDAYRAKPEDYELAVDWKVKFF